MRPGRCHDGRSHFRRPPRADKRSGGGEEGGGEGLGRVPASGVAESVVAAPGPAARVLDTSTLEQPPRNKTCAGVLALPARGVGRSSTCREFSPRAPDLKRFNQLKQERDADVDKVCCAAVGRASLRWRRRYLRRRGCHLVPPVWGRQVRKSLETATLEREAAKAARAAEAAVAAAPAAAATDNFPVLTPEQDAQVRC